MVIAIGITNPIPAPKANEQVIIDLTFDAVPIIAGSVVLIRKTGLPFQTSRAIIPNGATGQAIFREGQVPAGVYEVHAFAKTSTDSGESQGSDLTVDPSVSPLELEFTDRIVSVIQDSGDVLDQMPDVGSLVTPHPDILRDSLSNLSKLAQSPGIIVSPGGLTEEGEEEEFITTNAKKHTLRATVTVGQRAGYDGLRGDTDYEGILNLRSAAQLALEADQQLGGFLKRALIMTEVETMEVKPPNISNATILLEVFEVRAIVIRRRGARR